MPSNNPEYQKRYIREHYQKNKQYYKDKAKFRDQIIRPRLYEFVNRYKLMKGCADCGYKEHAIALQFDHVRGEKFKDVSIMVRNCSSISKIKEEIRKCEVRCSNCHAVVTHQRRKLN